MALEFWEFFRQVLILLITISLYFPLNVPLAALACKVRVGSQPVPLPMVSFWLRATLAAAGMAVLSLSLMGLDKFLTVTGLPRGLVHLVMCFFYVPLGAWWMFKVFAQDDMWEGLSTLLLYVFLPGFVLVVARLLTGLEPPHFIDLKEWIAPVPTSS
jgi:hypothetical protein